MIFFFTAVLFMYAGRKVGWVLSRLVLYRAPTPIAGLVAVAWGAAVAVLVIGLIQWQHPAAALKWIMGYALGAYVAIPAYGLVVDSSIPAEARGRHTLVSNLPLAVYVCSLVLPALIGLGP